MDLIRSISWMSASHLRLIRDDDSYIDRLSHRYTVAICVIFCIVVSTKQYAGDPIDCWVPAQFKASYEKYADSYCWIAGSWYTPMDKDLPLDAQSRKQHRIRYYQWVPFLLLFQAILCYIPRIVWRSLNVRSGLDLVNLVDAAIKYESVDKFTDREKIMSYIVQNVERHIGARRSRYERLYGKLQSRNDSPKQTSNSSAYADAKNRLNRSSGSSCCQNFWRRVKLIFSTICFWTGKRLGNYLVILYMFVKSLWVTNAISQLFLLNRFIGNDYHAFGLEIIEMLLSGQEWNEMRHFPRVTYCDFKIREIGNSHDWTVQCVLRINLFNEVIYIFMWFWLCILALFSIFDFLTWSMHLIMPGDKLRFVKRHLDIYNCFSSEQKSDTNYNSPKRNRPDFEYVDIQKEKALMRDFTFNYLKDDGIFAMRILSSSASDLITTEIMSELWKNFRQGHHDETDHISLDSSSSHSSSSTNESSEITSAASIPSPVATQPKQLQQQQHSSPDFVKKPFNFNPNQNQSDRNGAYSPPQTNQNQLYMTQSNNSKNQLHTSQTGNFPTTTMPHTNHSKFDQSASSVQNFNNQNSSKDSEYKQQRLQPRHIHLEQNSNINPNSKDTHV